MQMAELEKVTSRDQATIEQLKKQILTADLKIQVASRARSTPFARPPTALHRLAQPLSSAV